MVAEMGCQWKEKGWGEFESLPLFPEEILEPENQMGVGSILCQGFVPEVDVQTVAPSGFSVVGLLRSAIGLLRSGDAALATGGG